MKFYYNDKLVRTSANHMYTHAVIDVRTGKVIGCRSSEQTAHSVISSEISGQRGNIKGTQVLMKAIEQKKKMYRCTLGNRSWYEPVTKEDSIEKCLEWIKYHEDRIKYIQENWKVVKLEAREA